MKKVLFILYIGLVFYLDAKSQIDSIPVRLAGRVESVDSTFQLPYVHVINKRTGMGVITDSMGVFKTQALETDTLIFRCMGFDDFIYQMPDTIRSKVFFIGLKMSPISYQIRVVDVYALTPRNQFKYDFINMQVNESEWPNQDIVIPGVTNPNYRKLREAERSIYPSYIGGPLAFLYKNSAKGQSYLELQRLVNEDKMLAASHEKYNMNKLGKFSHFSGDTLLAFFIYLNFSAAYIFNTPEYDLYLEILRKTSLFEKHFAKHGLPVEFLKKKN